MEYGKINFNTKGKQVVSKGEDCPDPDEHKLDGEEEKQMDVADTLEQLKKKALADPELCRKLLNTRNSKTPLADFCKLSTEAGLPLYEMDVLEFGESSYAAMRRSTNGGGENSPMLFYEDDTYEMFLSELESRRRDGK